MSISQVSLSSSARQNLLALQGTAKLLNATQAHLSSGKKVNSALDNATSYFASQGFLNSASDLSNLKDNMSTALQTIKAATDAIDSITSIVNQMQAIVTSALQSSNDTTRSNYATQYNALRTQLDTLANDSTFNGTNLLNSLSSQLKIIFNADDSSNLVINSQNMTSAGMGVGTAQNNFAVGAKAKEVTNALTVQSTNQTIATPQTYAGNIALTASTVTVGSSTGVGAVLTSNNSSVSFASTHAADIADGAVVSASSAANGLTDLEDWIGGALITAVAAAAVSTPTTIGAGVLAAGTYETTTGNSLIAGGGFSVSGQFTVTGGAGATYDAATNTLTTSGVAASTKISVGVGQTVKIVYDNGNVANTSGAQIFMFTNTGSAAVELDLANGAADTVQANNINSSATYNLATGSVSAAGLSDIQLEANKTLAGNATVDSGSAAVGTSLTVTNTTSGTGLTLGTTTQASVTAYDVADAVVGSLDITSVWARSTDGAAATYNTTNASNTASASVTVSSGLTVLTGSSTTVVADAITTAQNQLTDSLTALRSLAASLGNNNSLVQTRLDFTSSKITTLQTASDNLVLADTNEEGANMQALQAQSQLGIIALGISGQQAQAVLKLF
ncbi:MAG: hypothetical protein HGA90_01280 [Alphaproteobacteria bacterium]|nr:hypothetical protein [Alphaproteobacteria bacterium]